MPRLRRCVNERQEQAGSGDHTAARVAVRTAAFDPGHWRREWDYANYGSFSHTHGGCAAIELAGPGLVH